MLLLFAVAIFSSAGLLFLVQPMVAKQLLPMLGGSPSVWNTCMVFFQTLLLAGYGYAHLLSKLPSPRVERLVHFCVMAAALAALPIGSGAGGPATGESPGAWLLLRLTASVGAPFFLLASASPLIQRWFGATDHRLAGDPYFLYAVSNTGSLLALLGYPLVVEPNVPLTAQLISWSWGFGGFALLALTCVWLGTRGAGRRAGAAPDPAPPLRWGTRLRWTALAFVPSSLLLGATQHLATDVASTPVLWVVPLAIYLSTFIAAFTERGRVAARWADRAIPLAAVCVGILLAAGIRTHIWPQVAVHLIGLGVISLACHGRLSSERPPARQLTGFYLTLSLGGALGGAFNALLAPLLFDRVAEYPIALALACVLRPPRALDPAKVTARPGGRPAWLADGLKGAAAIAGVAALFAWRQEIVGLLHAPATLLGLPSEPLLLGLVPGLGCLVWCLDRRAFSLALVALLAAPYLEQSRDVVFATRTFFGVHRVVRETHPRAPGHWHHLWHGSTGHGSQFSTPPWSRVPTRYFTRSGPAGDLMRVIAARPGPVRIGVVGLGVGTLAAYGRPDWHMTYFEIDPAVVRIARDPELFTYCRDSEAKLVFVVGDARLRLRDSDERFDALVLDAFSSDAVPVHLITREAVELYLERLRPDGILAFQVTNLHLDLEPVLASIARDLDLAVAARSDTDLRGHPSERKDFSAWVVLAKRRESFGEIATDRRWRRIAASSERRTWTDDYSNVFGVLR